MKWSRIFLPALTAAAVLLAVVLPQSLFVSWDKKHLDVLQEEAVDDDQLVTNYTLSTSECLHLLRYSGIQAQNGEIVHGNASSSVSVISRTILPQTQTDTGEKEERFYDSISYTPLQGSISEHMRDYLYQGLYFLVEYGVADNALLLHYQKCDNDLQMQYCTVTDANDPFFSITLLCVQCTMKDAAPFGLTHDTTFSLVLDEETGAVYALSFSGDAALVLTEHCVNYGVLADMMGTSLTEYSETLAPGGTYPEAVFNFGGYSYRLNQTVAADGLGVLNFNLDSKA